VNTLPARAILEPMHPLVRASAVVAALFALGGPAERAGRSEKPERGALPLAGDPASGPCPKQTLPMGSAGACIPLPNPSATGGARSRRLALAPSAAPELTLRGQAEGIERLPDRPEPFGDYQLPIDATRGVTPPSPEIGGEHGVELHGSENAPVTLVDFEGQEGRPEVALVGELHGITVIVRHRVKLASGERQYLAIYGRLARPGPRIVSAAVLEPLAVIGHLGEGPHPSLYFEVRQLRAPLEGSGEHLSQLVSNAMSVPTDPRNVLPLRK
jgi:hypothetical protein